jgi:Holliday junction resolvase RusA-like endonuclease
MESSPGPLPGRSDSAVDGLPDQRHHASPPVSDLAGSLRLRLQTGPSMTYPDVHGWPPPRLAVTLPGTPQAQGSKIKNAAGAMYDTNKELRAWRADAIHTIIGAFTGPKIYGPVVVDATFKYARPRNHFGTGRNATTVKPSAPIWKATAPDLDKLQRALGDALTQAGVIADDRLIVRWECGKQWTEKAPCTDVWLWESEP